MGVKYPDMPKLKQYAKDEKIAPGPVLCGGEDRQVFDRDNIDGMMPIKGDSHIAEVNEALENIYPVK